MKTLKNFAGQQLSKTDMLSVKGGAIYCDSYDEHGRITEKGVSALDTIEKSEEVLKKSYEGTGIRWICYEPER